MDTQTHLIAGHRKARLMAAELFNAADRAEAGGEWQHVRTELEQANAKGPWRLVITVAKEED